MSGFTPIPFDAEIPVPTDRRPPPLSVGLEPGEDLWVFGYGSLMWDPGFPHEEARPAVLHGFHRGFIVRSTHYRGTAAAPGLVLGLARGGSCQGRAFRVAAESQAAVLDYIWRREMINGLYLPYHVRIRFPHGGPVRALTMVVDTGHADCWPGLTLDHQAEIIAAACGWRGPNCDYLFNTVRQLESLGLRDRKLHTLADMVRARTA